MALFYSLVLLSYILKNLFWVRAMSLSLKSWTRAVLFEYSAKEANVSISLEDKTASSIWDLGACKFASWEAQISLQMDEWHRGSCLSCLNTWGHVLLEISENKDLINTRICLKLVPIETNQTTLYKAQQTMFLAQEILKYKLFILEVVMFIIQISESYHIPAKS